jgi:K+/H+ antiporter YhaU regulatory subunit KhtT
VPHGIAGPVTTGELRRSGATLLAVRSASGRLSVGPDNAQQLQADDLIVAMGTRDQLAAMAQSLRPPVPR